MSTEPAALTCLSIFLARVEAPFVATFSDDLDDQLSQKLFFFSHSVK